MPESGLLSAVCVDDLLLSGPERAHSAFWDSLRSGEQSIALDEPESLDRFLGRGHEEVITEDGPGLAFAMGDYCRDTVRLYSELTGRTKFKAATTPFCPEGSLPVEDEEVRGELTTGCCSILMKALWLARLSRPDVQKPIGDMATHVQAWTRNDDRRLHRLICYLHYSQDYRLVGRVNDPSHLLTLRLYVDADFAGEREDSRSTSGGWLCLHGPHTMFPLVWISRKQTYTSRSTTESEIVAMAGALFGEALPTLDLWDMLLKRPMTLEVMEDNQATIKIVRKGYSMKLRHINRTHKVNLGGLKEVFDDDNVVLSYVETHSQAADIFTKALQPIRWDNALKLLGIYKQATRAKVAP